MSRRISLTAVSDEGSVRTCSHLARITPEEDGCNIPPGVKWPPMAMRTQASRASIRDNAYGCVWTVPLVGSGRGGCGIVSAIGARRRPGWDVVEIACGVRSDPPLWRARWNDEVNDEGETRLEVVAEELAYHNAVRE